VAPEPIAASVQVDDFPAAVERIQLPGRGGDNAGWVIFGVLAILLVLGLASAGPGILIVLLILAIPVMIRAVFGVLRPAAQGSSRSGLDIFGAFVSSIGIVALVCLASFAAFYATCFVVCAGGLSLSSLNDRGKNTPYGLVMVVSISAGLVPGLWVAYLLCRRFEPRFRRLWPRKD
jgi:hypothetical protein